MNIGKTLFAQLMDFLPWKTFHRIVDRCGGDRYVKSMTCADQFRVMAFAQLTYRESLRDIEVCLSAQSAKLYHMGLRQETKRSTLADANEARDWRIHAEFAQRLIEQARKLYVGDSFGISENAVKSQIWIAVSVYVLVAIVKKRLNLDASLYTLLQIFSLTLFEKMPIQQAFPGSDYKSEQGNDCNQLNLFAF